MSETPNVVTYQGDEFRARGDAALFPARPVTLVSTQAKVAGGTVVGKITATGLYKAYSNAADDGSEVAAGILVSTVDPVTEDRDVPCAMYIGGIFKRAKLIGLDAQAEADLKAAGAFTFE